MDKKDKFNIFRSYAKRGVAPAKFVEVMTCANGCITGPVAYNPDLVTSEQIFNKALAACNKSYKDSEPAKQ